MITYLDDGTRQYQPGVCNIGPAEIGRRRRLGYVGVAGAVILAGLLLAMDAPGWTRLAIALPVAVGISGLIQARLRFCAGFGMAGLQNMGELGHHVRVEDTAARAADRRKALLINGVAAAGGIGASLVFVLLP